MLICLVRLVTFFLFAVVSNNVGDFIEMLKCEDRGIDSVFVRNAAGVRIASMTSIQSLFDEVTGN
jgi:hypothetical protein